MRAILLIVSLLVFCGWGRVEAVTYGTCQYLTFVTLNAYLNSTCGNVVDYKYYLPVGVTEQTLNSQAAAKLQSTKLMVLPATCQMDLKKLVCASIYLKCAPNWDATKPSTFNYQIYTDFNMYFVPLPFQRPCVRLCTAVTVSYSPCWGLLSLFGLQPNCTATVDYSSGAISYKPHQYDFTNDEAQCNGMDTEAYAASSKEQYLSPVTGACAGITTELWVPPPSKVSSSFAPIQAPYQMQIVIDTQLKTKFLAAKTFVSSSCLFAMRKLTCATSYMKPMLNHLGYPFVTTAQQNLLKSKGINATAMVKSPVYFPSYPSSSLCTAFQTACAAYSSVPTFVAKFAVNCSLQSAGIYSYPAANQTLLTITIPNNPQPISLKFSTPPNNANDAVNIGFSAPTATGTCSSPLTALSTEYFCSDTVDYSFYVPSTSSLAALDAVVVAKLNSSKLSVLPSACHVALKKFVCGSVYLKCQPNIVLSNTITWNYAVYKEVGIPLPLPIQRPCISICQNAKSICRGLLAVFGKDPNCTTRYDYSGGIIGGGTSSFLQPYQYDHSDDTDQCNSVPANIEITSTAPGTCSSALTSLSTKYACSNAVDYSFYVPGSSSLAALDNLATSKLNNSKLALLPASCLVALQKLVCGSVYLKCQPNITINNMFTWNYGVYSDVGIGLPVPVQRPCVSLCHNANDQCLGMLSLFGIAPNCTGRYDYSGGLINSTHLQPYQYDQSDDTTQCSSVPAGISIGYSMESYRHSDDGACAGITENIYVPPGSAFKKQFPAASGVSSLLNSPYVIQQYIEKTLTASFSKLPIYMSSSCHLALRKYFCGKSFLSPELQIFGRTLRSHGVPDSVSVPYLTSLGVNATDILNFAFYLPAYPDASICTDYATECKSFFAIAQKTLSAAAYDLLVPQCDATSSGIEIFSNRSQTILELKLKFANGTSISFDTSPQKYSSSSEDYEPSCPSGFVIPEDPDNKRTRMISGTGCALACYA
jgi:hypothetical protein